MILPFVFPNKILYGPGSVNELPVQLKNLGAKRPLIVTDRGLVDAGLADRLCNVLLKAGIEAPVFSDVDPNPIEDNVDAGDAVYKQESCDCVIGFGGGSALDVAKMVRLKVNHPMPLVEYALVNQGMEKIINPLPPMVAISTTAGTGSEVARGALIIVRPAGNKVAIAGEGLYPTLTLCDPELIVDLPPFLTAGTGMDAFTHCIEEYLAPKFNPFVAGMALEGIRLCAENLLVSYRDGKDIEARGNMMIASMIGGIGFIKGLGVVHSLSHPVGSVVGGHHGTTNAVFLPASLEFNFEAAPEKYRPMCFAAGIAVEGMSDKDCGSAFVDYIRDLNTNLNIPADLSAMGAKREHIPQMLPMCMADHCHLTNARPCQEEDFKSLLEAHIPA